MGISLPKGRSYLCIVVFKGIRKVRVDPSGKTGGEILRIRRTRSSPENRHSCWGKRERKQTGSTIARRKRKLRQRKPPPRTEKIPAGEQNSRRIHIKPCPPCHFRFVFLLFTGLCSFFTVRKSERFPPPSKKVSRKAGNLRQLSTTAFYLQSSFFAESVCHYRPQTAALPDGTSISFPPPHSAGKSLSPYN